MEWVALWLDQQLQMTWLSISREQLSSRCRRDPFIMLVFNYSIADVLLAGTVPFLQCVSRKRWCSVPVFLMVFFFSQQARLSRPTLQEILSQTLLEDHATQIVLGKCFTATVFGVICWKFCSKLVSFQWRWLLNFLHCRSRICPAA